MVYVGTEAIAASAFPGYSYSANYISDLGVPDVAEFQGRAIDSPLSAVMNAGFILQGVLYLVAAVALGAAFLWRAYALWRQGTAPEESTAQAIRLYRYSITYLAVLFAAVALDTMVRVQP